ncbi:mechanosensitive ion channel, partial [Erysipelothrix rhusiopathiae]|nr:mechanosensitive ion channel [Erysipelothrix rhusiopathiae]
SKEKEPFILSKETLFKTEEIVKESCFKANILLSDFSLQNIAVTSIGSVAVGFGAQQLVKDVINGFFILSENQFNVGDVVSFS